MVNADHITATTVHPLEPLTATELGAATALLKGQEEVPGSARFVSVTLQEPVKDALAGHAAGGEPPAREAHAVLVDRATGRLLEALVDIDERAVRSVGVVADAHPTILLEEYELAATAIRNDPQWQRAMRKRGIEDFDRVQIDPLSAGRFGEEFEEQRRVARGVSYLRRYAADNGWARPIEGVIAYVDLNTFEVFRVDDFGVVSLPDVDGSYDADRLGLRDDLKPLDIVQSDGPSFTVDGHEIRWQRWRLRVSLHPIEGLVLHTVGYEDQGRVRSVMHRASLAEMVVPYGETSPMHFWKNYFDAGEYGLGKLSNSLELGCDCLGEIRYLDAHLVDGDGHPYPIRNAICLHEEDYGILWKHTDYITGEVEVRRSRRLVVSAIFTAGNYDYGLYWYLYQDGSIQAEVKLTGIVATMAVEHTADLRHSEPVAERLAAPHHQHLFCFRLDLDVDGTANSVVEIDAEGQKMGDANPNGNAFQARSRPLRRERQARRLADPGRSRQWKVINESSHSALGEPVAYKLIPGQGTATLLADAGSSIARRAGFARKNLWVTPHRDAERFPAGEYVYQHPGGAGLPQWTARDRPIENTDVVLWYCCGTTHFVRPEDWPVMPVECVGFTLKPHGFFDRNPALDVAPPPHCRPDTGASHNPTGS